MGYSDYFNIAMMLAKIAPELIENGLDFRKLIFKALSKPFYHSIRLKFKLYEPLGRVSKRMRLKNQACAYSQQYGVYPKTLIKRLPTYCDERYYRQRPYCLARSIPGSKHITIKDTNHMDIIKAPNSSKQ